MILCLVENSRDAEKSSGAVPGGEKGCVGCGFIGVELREVSSWGGGVSDAAVECGEVGS